MTETPDGPFPASAPSRATDDILGLVTTLVAPSEDDRADASPAHLLGALVDEAAHLVGPADWSSVTLLRPNTRARTLAASDDHARAADRIQYAVGSGPCLDAAREDNVYCVGRIEEDPRWPEYGRRVHDELGVSSVLAYRLVLLGSEEADAALNIYSTRADAFDTEAVRRGLVLATQCSLLISAHLANDRADNLLRGLASNRDIGVAVGVLMANLRVTRDQGFGLLRMASQDLNRKLADIAVEVAETGELPIRRLRRVQPDYAE